MNKFTKRVVAVAVAALSLSAPILSTGSTVSAITQAQNNKRGYAGPAKLTRTIKCYRVVHLYHAGHSKIIRKGTHVHVMGGAGHWHWIVTYRGKHYFYLRDGAMSVNEELGWFKEI